MNARLPPASLPQVALTRQLMTTARLGLLSFAEALSAEQFSLPLRRSVAAAMSVDEDGLPSWQNHWRQIEEYWPPDSEALGQWLAESEHAAEEALILGLLLAVESDHQTAQLLQALQSPDPQPWPAQHFLLSWMDFLLEEDASHFTFRESRCVQSAMIVSCDDGPLSLQHYRIADGLAASLLSGSVSHRVCTKIPTPQRLEFAEQTLAELRGMASRLADDHTAALLLRGESTGRRGELAAGLASYLQLHAYSLSAEDWLDSPSLQLAFQLCKGLAVVDCDDGAQVQLLAENASRGECGRLIILVNDKQALPEHCVEWCLDKPTYKQREKLWSTQLASLADNWPENSLTLFAQAQIGVGNIRSIAADFALQWDGEQGIEALRPQLATARHRHSRGKLSSLAEPIERIVSRQALVLPDSVHKALDHFLLHCQRREQLWQCEGARFGSSLRASPNTGVRALFVGASGTGKTLAASYVASQLAAPLYRVDMASLMNKYIGETEKNLAALLDQAANEDVVLLFDEAEALFGQRGETKDNGGRFANMLTNYLLSRIESHPGVVILTTNYRDRIDEAFNRRIDLSLEFPRPEYSERLGLWQGHFGEKLADPRLAECLAEHCDFAGGQLRNVVIAAAVQAGERPIDAAAVMLGLEIEYRKLGSAMPSRLRQSLSASTADGG